MSKMKTKKSKAAEKNTSMTLMLRSLAYIYGMYFYPFLKIKTVFNHFFFSSTLTHSPSFLNWANSQLCLSCAHIHLIINFLLCSP